ncbi:MAG: preprotein translocase subunit SecY [Candidatus Micrarchaeia archaeon]
MLHAFKPIIDLLPEVKAPTRPPTLQVKLYWTLAGLLIFFILGQIFPIGVNPNDIVFQQFQQLEILLGSKTGSLITSGIGPIVLASIFLQLAVGAKIINLDLSIQENKKLFQGIQKLLAIALSFLEAIIYVWSGYIPVDKISPLFGSVGFTIAAVAFQLALGSIILLYLDEVLQKYGIGSGISLFIAAGVAQAIFLGAFSFISASGTGDASGLVFRAIASLTSGSASDALWLILPLIFTVIVFLVVVYAEGMRIELPLSYGRARGLGARYPLKFLYVSNIPVILASAVLLNIQLMGMFLAGAGMPIFGTYSGNTPQDGLAYYLTPLQSPLFTPGGYQGYLGIILTPEGLLHIFVYGFALVSLSVVFGWFWVESTGMGAKQVSEQLGRSGLLIPGFRQDPRVTEKILDRYIPVITVLGAGFVGVLAWFADITGALGTGTGILLTVGILYRFYEDLAKQQVFEQYPMLDKILK